jgi:two-component system, cell cycle response regulator
MKIVDPEQELEVQSSQGKNLQVLVVDDSPVYHKLVSDALCYQPYSLLHATSGSEALELFAKHSPPIVITDWMMPDLTGPELCKRIRASAKNLYTYLILLTSMSESDSLVNGLEAGADEFLTKPFDPAELQARLGVGRRIVELHRQVEAKDRQLEETLRIDTLTGLTNHVAIQEWAPWQIRAAAQHRFSIWVVLADVDSMGKINERYGREAGNAVLKAFAKIITDNSRPADICARAGDDKFALLVTHQSNKSIAEMIDRYRFQFAAHSFIFEGKMMTATASFGAIGFEGTEAPTFSSLVKEAQKALLAAKQAGGNQMRILSFAKLESGSDLLPPSNPHA